MYMRQNVSSQVGNVIVFSRAIAVGVHGTRVI